MRGRAWSTARVSWCINEVTAAWRTVLVPLRSASVSYPVVLPCTWCAVGCRPCTLAGRCSRGSPAVPRVCSLPTVPAPACALRGLYVTGPACPAMDASTASPATPNLMRYTHGCLVPDHLASSVTDRRPSVPHAGLHMISSLVGVPRACLSLYPYF